MSFVRRFAMVVLVVSVIVAGGIVWEHASGPDAGDRSGGRVTDLGGPAAPEQVVPEQAAQDGLPPPVVRFDRPHGSRPVEYQNLIRTVLMELLIMAVVVGVSGARHRRRRARRLLPG